MKVSYLQLPADLVDARAGTLADLLTAGGRKTTEGDALLLVVRLWQWALGGVDETAEDLPAAFERATLLPTPDAALLVAGAVGWPRKKAQDLLDALMHPLVRVLQAEPAGVRVVGLAERYMTLASQHRDASDRARASQLARAAGWKPGKGGAWEGPNGAKADGWREMLTLLQPQKSSAVVEGRLMPLKAARVVRAAEED